MAFPWAAAAQIATAAAGLWSANKSRKQQRNARRRDMELAEQYGIHPLSAWGSAGTVSGDGGYGHMSEAISGAANSAQAWIRRQHQVEDQDVASQRQTDRERAKHENNIVLEQIRQNHANMRHRQTLDAAQRTHFTDSNIYKAYLGDEPSAFRGFDPIFDAVHGTVDRTRKAIEDLGAYDRATRYGGRGQ